MPNRDDIDNSYSGSLFFNWEIDFFGRLRRGAEASAAELLATESGTRAVMSLIVTDVAQLYVTLRTFDEQLAIIQRTIKAQEESLSLVQKLAAGGVASGSEVQQALNQLATTRAALPRTERQMVQTENALSVLIGRSPSAIVRGTAASTLPTAPDIPVGLPSQLLERRPDIVGAEQQLHAAVARLGVAVASKIPIPRIGLTAFVRPGEHVARGLLWCRRRARGRTCSRSGRSSTSRSTTAAPARRASGSPARRPSRRRSPTGTPF